MKLLRTIIKEFVKELQTENSSIILEPSLIRDIINTIFSEEEDHIVDVDDDIGLDWGEGSSPIQYELEFVEHYENGKYERSGLFVRLYLAATYDKFTLESALKYSYEIKNFINRNSLGNGQKGANYFLKTIKHFNKNIPTDLKLYLELM
jgi:hypothetical protein